MQPLPYKDITVKAKVDNLATIETQLTTLGAFFHGHDYQTDHYFKTHKEKLKYRAGTVEKLITHYERILVNDTEQTIVYRYDLNPTEDEVKKLFATETSIGVTKKERKIFFLEHIKIHLDKLENGEQFIEIEVIDRENKWTIDQLKNQCRDLQVKLQIPDANLIPTGYFS